MHTSLGLSRIAWEKRTKISVPRLCPGGRPMPMSTDPRKITLEILILCTPAEAGAHRMEETHEDLRPKAMPGRQAHAHEHQRSNRHRCKAQAKRVLCQSLLAHSG